MRSFYYHLILLMMFLAIIGCSQVTPPPAEVAPPPVDNVFTRDEPEVVPLPLPQRREPPPVNTVVPPASAHRLDHPQTLIFHPNELNPLLNINVLKNELLKWWGTRYRYGGESRSGVDCSGLTMKLYYALGYKLPHSAIAQLEFGKRVDKNALLVGDLLFFAEDKRISHVGMYVGEGTFLHASSSDGVTLSRLWHPYYWSRFIFAKRMVW